MCKNTMPWHLAPILAEHNIRIAEAVITVELILKCDVYTTNKLNVMSMCQYRNVIDYFIYAEPAENPEFPSSNRSTECVH